MSRSTLKASVIRYLFVVICSFMLLCTLGFGNGYLSLSSITGERNGTKYLRDDLTWQTPTAGSATWGSITGTLSSQTDLSGALSGKEPTITAGDVGQYWRGDKTWQTLPTASHERLHAITSTADHSSTASQGYILKADANGLPIMATNTDGQVSGAVNASHSHSNLATLDAITEALTTALKTSYDAAVTASHSHSNKSVLDATQESFTTVLKTSYDWLVTNITTAWKTTVDNFIASKGAANGLAPLDANSKVPTTNLGGAGADNTKYLRGDQTWVAPAGGSNPTWYGKFYATSGDGNPILQAQHENMLAVAGPTPTGIGITIGRCVMFTPPANITVTNIRLFGVGATTSLYKFAIYPVGTSTTKVWDSGTITTVANTWNNITAGLPVTLTAGTKYWWCVTVVATGTTAGFRSEAAPLGTNYWGANVAPLGGTSLGLPVYAQFTVTSPGVFPTTLPAIAAAAYAGGTTGSVPFGYLDYGGAK